MLVVSACGSEAGQNSAAESTQSGEPRRGGSITVATPGEPDCFDPQTSCDAFEEVAKIIADGLTYAPKGDWNNVEPHLAKSWEVSPDASTYTFVLRDDVTFSNGEKLDAALVRDNFKVLAALPKPTGGTLLLQDLKDVTAVDDHTVRVEFNKPNVDFLPLTAVPDLSILARETLDKSWEERAADGAIGSGPFVAQSYDFASGAVFTRRDDYAWAPASIDHGEGAYLDEITFLAVPEASSRAGALTSKQVDAANEVNAPDAAALEAQGIRIELQPEQGLVPQNWFLDTSDPILADENVRKAILHAIDRETAVQKALGDYAEPATSLLKSTSPSWQDLSHLLTYDPALSEQLLDEAGWVKDADGNRSKDGTPLKFTLTVRESHVPLAEISQEYLDQVGIDIDIRPITASEYEELIASGDYQANTWGSSNENFGDLFLTNLENRTKLSGAPGAELDQLIIESRGIVDPDERADATAKWHTLVLEKAYAIPVQDSLNIWGVRPEVQDFQFGVSRTVDYYSVWRSDS